MDVAQVTTIDDWQWDAEELPEDQGDGYGSLKLEDLPDEIIVHILSLLPLKDAAATSILSSRWRYFWRFTRLMSLDFDFDFDLTDNCCAMAYDVRYDTAYDLRYYMMRDSPNLVCLRVSGQSLALKYLEIIRCRKLKSVKICEVNIVSLYLDGKIKASNFILRDVPLLVELYIDFFQCSSDFKRLFSHCLSQIEVLRMIDLHRAPYYLAPLMKDLTLSYGRVPKRPHYRLKEVEILEYSSKFGDMDRVLYLIRNTVGLQRIVINCKYNNPLRIMKTKQQLLEDEEVSRRHAMTQLQPQVPSDIQFVCL
ncbi:hypothetical protein FNV43_RR15759 [Rhamnella rubrinervis]|uniref:F-box domain-containing protein n=1 Tax=Rhamnella rubrinervis TaxID=2594499 RepID=A0A8K0E9H8_9ROSA|nr:hypothetical protein FNV43_RR15759 [Rhamnella rubrinervis]